MGGRKKIEISGHAFAKLRKATIKDIHVCLSVRPHGTARLSLEELSLNLIVENFSKIYIENSLSIEIWPQKQIFYIKTNIHLWRFLAHFSVEWEMFQTKVVEQIKTHILCTITFLFLTIFRFMRKCGKILQNEAGHRWQHNMAHAQAGHRLQYTRNMAHAHWILGNRGKNTYTLKLLNKYFFPLTGTTVTQTLLRLTLYVYVLSCFLKQYSTGT